MSLNLKEHPMAHEKCDKCGEEIPLENNVVLLVAELARCKSDRHMSWAYLVCTPRHLLPVVKDGKVVCEGSPSSAQYLEGQPRDTRPEYPYQPEHEQRCRDAYARVQWIAREAAKSK